MSGAGFLQRDDIDDRCDLFAHVLTFIALWTLLVKFVVPAFWAASLGQPLTAFVMWDLWWVVHLALAWGLRERESWVFLYGVLVSVLEIGIVLWKFYLYFAAPVLDSSFFRLAWFTNKVAVLLTFAALLPFLLRREVRAHFAVASVP